MCWLVVGINIVLRITTAHNHHYKTIQRLVNKHWTRFRTKQKGNPELPRNITMCYRRNPSLRNKLASQNKIHTRIGNTNKPTHTKTSLHKQMLEQKMPHMPDIPTRHQFLRTTLGTTHRTKCNSQCRSNGIVYQVTCKRCHKHYLGQTSNINYTPATSETPTIPNAPNPFYRFLIHLPISNDCSYTLIRVHKNMQI